MAVPVRVFEPVVDLVLHRRDLRLETKIETGVSATDCTEATFAVLKLDVARLPLASVVTKETAPVCAAKLAAEVTPAIV